MTGWRAPACRADPGPGLSGTQSRTAEIFINTWRSVADTLAAHRLLLGPPRISHVNLPARPTLSLQNFDFPLFKTLFTLGTLCSGPVAAAINLVGSQEGTFRRENCPFFLYPFPGSHPADPTPDRASASVPTESDTATPTAPLLTVKPTRDHRVTRNAQWCTTTNVFSQLFSLSCEDGREISGRFRFESRTKGEGIFDVTNRETCKYGFKRVEVSGRNLKVKQGWGLCAVKGPCLKVSSVAVLDNPIEPCLWWWILYCQSRWLPHPVRVCTIGVLSRGAAHTTVKKVRCHPPQRHRLFYKLQPNPSPSQRTCIYIQQTPCVKQRPSRADGDPIVARACDVAFPGTKCKPSPPPPLIPF
ncbi:hypothetical protein Bbelb_000520 [Branchiostoma belcheri]|nr:hypothetical protein Bbelb_000520 [Branchiostoma belcheri]